MTFHTNFFYQFLIFTPIVLAVDVVDVRNLVRVLMVGYYSKAALRQYYAVLCQYMSEHCYLLRI